MYKEIYKNILENAKNRILTCYTEKHHIIPRYQGGTNSLDNIVELTYREHVIVHFLRWKLFNNPEDKCAYMLMMNYSVNRKIEVGKMVAEINRRSGHISRLAKHNKDTKWMLEIQTKEFSSLGGKKGGKIAKDTGQIYTIKTKESCTRGGITAGNLAKERNQVQQVGKFKGNYVLIMPDGTEFLHTFQAAEYMNLSRKIISSRCKQHHLGFSRRLKQHSELGVKGILLTEQN